MQTSTLNGHIAFIQIGDLYEEKVSFLGMHLWEKAQGRL